MQRPLLPGGSAFRNKVGKEPTIKDMEAVMVNSGLLGKRPKQYKIKYSKPSLADQKPPSQEIICIPNKKNSAQQNRPKTAIAANRKKISAYNSALGYLDTENQHNSNTKHNTPRTTRTPRDFNEESISQRPLTPTMISPSELELALSIPTLPSDIQNDSIVLKPENKDKTLGISNIFYGRVLSTIDPPSDVNFVQLNELLDRLLPRQSLTKQSNEEEEEEEFHENETSDIKKIYYNIFGEVIRQYFIECQAEGNVLNNCREYFALANTKIPKIQKHYDDIIDRILEERDNNQKQIEVLGPEIQKNQERRQKLQTHIEQFRKDLKVLTDHHDVLMNQISSAYKELMDMKMSINMLNSRLDKKNKKLMELIDELRSLDSISASYTSDTIRFAENLREIRQQQEAGRKQINEHQEEVKRLRETIKIIDKDILMFTEEIEQSRIKPEVTHFAIQVDLISRRLFKEVKSVQRLMKQTRQQRMEFTGSLFQQVRDEFKTMKGEIKSGEIILESYDDYAKFKAIILKRESELHMSNEVIEAAQKGDFDYNPNRIEDSKDFVNIFASYLTQNAICDAIQNPPCSRVSTQTFQPKQEYQEEDKNVREISYKSTFLKFIDSDYSQRQSQHLEWLLKTIRELYEAKAISDGQILANGYVSDLPSFPEFVYKYVRRNYDLDFLADQMCWDIYITSHEHKGRSLEIDIFIKFLDEEFDVEQLAFFLIMRADILKVGSPVTMPTSDGLEKYNEYFLAEDQIDRLMHTWWFNRYKKEYVNSVMEKSIPRPAIHLEAAKRYVSMHDVLLKNVEFYQIDSVDRLQSMLLQYRIMPRLNYEQFQKLLKMINPTLEDDQIQEFYRATVTKSKDRENTSLDDFVDRYNKETVIVRKYTMTAEEKKQLLLETSSKSKETSKVKAKFEQNLTMSEENEKKNYDIFQAISKNWSTVVVELSKIIDFFQSQSSLQPDNLTLRMLLDDAIRYLNNMKHAMAVQETDVIAIHYYQLLFSVDILFSTIQPTELTPESLISIECSIRESWLEKAYI